MMGSSRQRTRMNSIEEIKHQLSLTDRRQRSADIMFVNFIWHAHLSFRCLGLSAKVAFPSLLNSSPKTFEIVCSFSQLVDFSTYDFSGEKRILFVQFTYSVFFGNDSISQIFLQNFLFKSSSKLIFMREDNVSSLMRRIRNLVKVLSFFFYQPFITFFLLA